MSEVKNNGNQETGEKKDKKEGFFKKAGKAVKGTAKKTWPVVKKVGSVAVKGLTVAGAGYALYAGIKTNRKPNYTPLLDETAYTPSIPQNTPVAPDISGTGTE